jgi:aminoglycoside phosphotransferase (APT) family kinase protein
MKELGWLPDPSVDAILAAVASVAPDLQPGTVRVRTARESRGSSPSRGTATLDDRYMVKFACSERAAAAIYREGLIFELLGQDEFSVPVPNVVAIGRHPALVITEMVAGEPLAFDDPLLSTPDGQAAVGRVLGRTLSALHDDAVREAVIGASLNSVRPQPQAGTPELRNRFLPLVSSDLRALVLTWCEWTDEALASEPPPDCFVHGDLHGFNQVWDLGGPTLHGLVDLEESGLADPHYDFRYLPAQAPGVVLLECAVASYTEVGSRTLSIDRIMAWHVRTCLGDALWRTEAGVALPDGGTVDGWVDDLARRFTSLSLRPG